ncbi:MAG TPA: class I SAM-dependent methyltransferase [Thermoanaerobaculia bacterium]|nr:class I SAM-dependent methyltransferase [Thermoanaerobaculia bacterium]
MFVGRHGLRRRVGHGYRRDWLELGANEPYFAVLTEERYLRERLDESARQSFWASGEAHVERLAGLVRDHFRFELRPQRALDYGCGVGRVLLPLARRSLRAVGADVSPAMLAEARRACEERGLDGVDLVEIGEDLAALSGDFDLVHSFALLQHLPAAAGMELIAGLLERLVPGGLAMLHVTYARPPTGLGRALLRRWRGVAPSLRGAANLLAGRRWGEPYMQMNAYDVGAVLTLLRDTGCQRIFTTFTDHGGMRGVMLIAAKRSVPSL